jgi:hypothetical protein
MKEAGAVVCTKKPFPSDPQGGGGREIIQNVKKLIYNKYKIIITDK